MHDCMYLTPNHARHLGKSMAGAAWAFPRAHEPSGSLQRRLLEETVAVCGAHLQLRQFAVAGHGERHLDTGRSKIPDLAEQVCQAADPLTGDLDDDIPKAHAGALGGTAP